MPIADRLSATFSALADPTRRAILTRLNRGPAIVTELAEPFAISLPAISRHLKVLEAAELITRGREGQWRPCMLNGKPLREVAEWAAHYRRHWERRLDRMEEYLQELQQADSATTTSIGTRARRKGNHHVKD